jgi:hypothetical protein
MKKYFIKKIEEGEDTRCSYVGWRYYKGSVVTRFRISISIWKLNIGFMYENTYHGVEFAIRLIK